MTLGHDIESETAVDVILAEAEAAGGRSRSPDNEPISGGYSSYFADPDGHRYRVSYNPLMKIE